MKFISSVLTYNSFLSTPNYTHLLTFCQSFLRVARLNTICYTKRKHIKGGIIIRQIHLRETRTAVTEKVVESLFSVLPIVIIVFLLCLYISPMQPDLLLTFLVGALMLIIGTVLDSNGVPQEYYIYLLMGLLSVFSWPGMARLVRGQILFLREQEYMVAAEAMGYSAKRKIFKHLIPNILPQILVSMTLSLGSMILYESTLSYLNLGVRIPYASWGTMIEIISKRSDILQNNFNVWVPSGICIIIAVLGFNFIGDGLRDALDPKQRR